MCEPQDQHSPVNATNWQPSQTTGRRARRWLFHRVFRALMAAHNLVLAAGILLRDRRRGPAADGQHEVLLTGRFESENWLKAHLQPLAASRGCACLLVVATCPVPSIPKVVVVRPPGWLIRIVGDTLARLVVFAWTAVCRQPDIVGGFHLLVNGLVAIALAPLVGAQSMYFCVGGPAELARGAAWCGEGEGPDQMHRRDPVVERRLLRALRACDTIITMGTRAARMFKETGIPADVHVVSGGIDPKRFRPADVPRSIDLILTARIAPIKRIDICLRAVALVARSVPGVTAAVVGDGPQLRSLQNLAEDLGVEHCVDFVGYQPNVTQWLRRSKIFVLTSDSEGLSLSMMEAMTCGLPAVASNVGDLGDLVEDAVNGYLVPRRRPQAFAERIVELLQDDRKLTAFSQAARRAALRHETGKVTEQWNGILSRPSPH